MALYPNGRKFQVYTQRALGGSQMAFSPYFVMRGDRMCRFVGETWGRGAGGMPSTGYAPGSPILPITYDGSMASTTGIASTSTLTATAIVASIGILAANLASTSIIGAVLTGSGALAANLLPYTPGSAEQIAYTVWGWQSEGSNAYGKQVRDMRAVLLGKTSGGGTTQETFYALDGVTPRVVSTNDGSNRTAVSTPGA